MLIMAGCSSTSEHVHEANGTASIDSNQVSLTSLSVPEPDPLQDEILADGSVSHAEMERVLLAAIACVEQEGFEAHLNYFRPRQGWSFGVSSPDETTVDLAGERMDECFLKLGDKVGSAYLAEHQLSENEQTAWEEAVVDCLIVAGNDIEGLTVSEALLMPDLVGYEKCRSLADATVVTD